MSSLSPLQTHIIVALFFALALSYIPVIGKFLKCFNTLIHESAHATCSLFFAGEVLSIDLFHTGAGLATTKASNWFTKIFVSLAGYVGSSMFAILCAYLIFYNHAVYILFIFFSLSLLNLIFWVRNVYGIVWLSVVSIIIGLLFYKGSVEYQNYAAILIGAVVFVDAWVSSLIILIISIKDAKNAGDAKNLQQLTYLPSLIWGLFFFAQATIAALWSVQLFVPSLWLIVK